MKTGIKEIRFNKATTFWGRNRRGKQAGIELMAWNDCEDEPQDLISFWPITTRGRSDSARLNVPVEHIPELIKALQDAIGGSGD